MIVCVLDMDETLGHFDDVKFLLRPKLNFLLDFLRIVNAKVILWSMGDDEYVKHVVNTFLEGVKLHAYKIFGNVQCERSHRRYGFCKASEEIRRMLARESGDAACEPVFLIGVDDRAAENMDSRYDLRIAPKPYVKHDPDDRELARVVEVIVRHLVSNFPKNAPTW